MTTLVTLATKDAIVMGCDSLGTVTKKLVDPFDLVPEFFDPEADWKLKTDEEGNPILRDFGLVWKKAQTVAFNQMTHVAKLFSLQPLEMGIMTTGIASIGNRTIKSLIQEFKSKSEFGQNRSGSNWAVEEIAGHLLLFFKQYFDKEYAESNVKPELALMLSGYDKEKPFPVIFRIFVDKDKTERVFPEEAPFGVAFGGQTQEIQRIVFGTDTLNRIKLIHRVNSLLKKYREFLQQYLKEREIPENLPEIENYVDELNLFNGWNLDGFDADWGDFSEQNAIACVDFFVSIMINSQQFSSRLPTVGGDVHIGLIRKGKGFRFISKEEYIHEGHITPTEE